MPLKNGKLTPKERVFAKHYSVTGDATYSAGKAGYRDPVKFGSANATDPAIAAHANALSLHRLKTELVPLAIKRHLAILGDDKVTGQTLNTAIALAYKHGLALANESDGKEPADMTPAELGAAIAALERARARGSAETLEAEAIDPAPADPAGIFG